VTSLLGQMAATGEEAISCAEFCSFFHRQLPMDLIKFNHIMETWAEAGQMRGDSAGVCSPRTDRPGLLCCIYLITVGLCRVLQARLCSEQGHQ
jgi:hypothetical protein